MTLLPMDPLAGDQWQALLAEAPVAVLYKHSPTCELSALALGEISRLVAERPELPVHLVDVIRQRPLSNAIEAETGIRHESPQALLFVDGSVVWHGSHRRVSVSALSEALDAAVADIPK